jgi:hypothetical protein
MTQTIWKFKLRTEGTQTIEIPAGAKLLHVGHQRSMLYLWALVNPGKNIVEREINIIGTGHDFDGEMAEKYIGTVQLDDLFVWHIFDGGEV